MRLAFQVYQASKAYTALDSILESIGQRSFLSTEEYEKLEHLVDDGLMDEVMNEAGQDGLLSWWSAQPSRRCKSIYAQVGLIKRLIDTDDHVSAEEFALKAVKKYEDAQEIVELLIENECVLIDFQYMLEAQARRCLDFIDGASKVLTGNLQKVGSSMYLLTPINVVVDIEEIGLAHGNQEANFDFDMKRR